LTAHAFVAVTLLYVYCMWSDLVYRRRSLVGLAAFLAAQVSVLVVGALIATATHAWHDIGHFFTTVGAGGLTGLLAGLAVVLLTVVSSACAG